MSRSREDRAEDLLRVAELAARNLELDLDDGDDDGAQEMKKELARAATRIRYLKARASAQWFAKFERVIDGSHSMRVRKLEAAEAKDSMRLTDGKCMACGRVEHNCVYAIDLAGNHCPEAWLGSVAAVRTAYTAFSSEYEAVFTGCPCARGKLHSLDKGTYLVGSTCLRKAKLRYLTQTFLLELCYASERELEQLSETVRFSRDTFYTVDDEAAERLVDEQDRLELAIADEKRPAPEICVDDEFWHVLDQARSSVGSDEISRNRALCARAERVMAAASEARTKRSAEQEADSDDVCSGSDDEYENYSASDEEEEEFAAAARRRGRGKRACVVDDDGEEEGARVGPSVVAHRTRARSRPPPAPVSAAAPASAAAASAPTGPPVAAEQAGPPAAAALAPAREARRATRADSCECINRHGPSEAPHTASVSGIACMQRADGVLPSRRAAMLALMELQVRLARQGRDEDAAVCTNSIQTIQDLLCRNERLAHTAGI